MARSAAGTTRSTSFSLCWPWTDVHAAAPRRAASARVTRTRAQEAGVVVEDFVIPSRATLPVTCSVSTQFGPTWSPECRDEVDALTFSTRGTRETLAVSVISSVIALAKPENGCERTKADARILRR